MFELTQPAHRGQDDDTPEAGRDFGELLMLHGSELRVHCYRMVGRLEDAEDLVQETYLRAWRRRDSLDDPAALRSWLYRIATNACLDVLRRDRRAVLLAQEQPVSGDGHGGANLPAASRVSWLDPYPDALLPAAPSESSPAERLVARETMRIAFIAAVQHLPPRQRAVLLLRDVVSMPAAECAAMLGISTPAANSLLQRARSAMRRHLGDERDAWTIPRDVSATERRVVERYVRATESGDLQELARLIGREASFAMPADGTAIEGGSAVVDRWGLAMAGSRSGRWQHLITAANRQPAVAAYWRGDGEDRFHAVGLDVVGILGGKVVEIATFLPATFTYFGLPSTLP